MARTLPLRETTSMTDATDHVDYTTEPTHLRLCFEAGEWLIDGRDDDGRYTEPCWSYDTRDEALADLADFVEKATQSGIVWRWRDPLTGPALAA